MKTWTQHISQLSGALLHNEGILPSLDSIWFSGFSIQRTNPESLKILFAKYNTQAFDMKRFIVSGYQTLHYIFLIYDFNVLEFNYDLMNMFDFSIPIDVRINDGTNNSKEIIIITNDNRILVRISAGSINLDGYWEV